MALKDRTALALAALAALQLLHLLDDLRTDETADLAGIFLRPQPVIGIGGALAALILVRRDNPLGRTLALTVAGLVAFGFVLSHGFPEDTGPTHPYWGDGSADALQWLGFSLILATCAATATLARKLPRSRSPLESARA